MTWTSKCEGTHSPDTRAQLWQETVWLSGEQCEHSPHSMERCAIMSLLSDKQEMKAFYAAFTVQKVIYPGGRSACCQRWLLIDPVGSKRVVTLTTLLTPEYLPSIIKYSWSQLRRCVPAYRRVSGLMMPSWGRHWVLLAAGYCTIMTGWNVTVSPECRAASSNLSHCVSEETLTHWRYIYIISIIYTSTCISLSVVASLSIHCLHMSRIVMSYITNIYQ